MNSVSIKNVFLALSLCVSPLAYATEGSRPTWSPVAVKALFFGGLVVGHYGLKYCGSANILSTFFKKRKQTELQRQIEVLLIPPRRNLLVRVITGDW